MVDETSFLRTVPIELVRLLYIFLLCVHASKVEELPSHAENVGAIFVLFRDRDVARSVARC